jgi:peptide/nickel transport system ATP-binding protein
MGILDPAARVTAGRIMLGRDILKSSERQLSEIRGRDIAMIFQNPRTALNPIRTAGDQIADVVKRHGGVARRAVRDKVVSMLSTVRIPDPAMRAEAYPYELSGGMCQRVGIALAMSCAPKLLIADEPTTGLDLTTQATIMDLMRDLVRSGHLAMILITHDLRLAAEYCDRVVVMHAGHVVETARTQNLFAQPRHPYTAALIRSTPSEDTRLDTLSPIEGGIPDLRRALPPCRFAARCSRRAEECVTKPLPRVTDDNGHMVACWRPL